MRDWAVVLGATALVSFLFGAGVGMVLNTYTDARDAAAYALVRDSLESLTTEVETCRYHVTRASANLSSLETQITRWLRRGRR